MRHRSATCDCPANAQGRSRLRPPTARFAAGWYTKSDLAAYSMTSSARVSSASGTVSAERLGGLEVDDQLDFRGLLDRQVGRLLALEDSARIVSQQSKCIRLVCSVAHQAACVDVFTRLSNAGN